MDKKSTNRKQLSQHKYRQTQSHKGLVRFELQVSQEAKAQFDALVTVAADEYATPWDPRRRQAKARAQIFDDITRGIRHEFFTLTDQISALKAEIKTLSPTFFQTTDQDRTPLPEAIRALPDDPASLKTLLAKLHREAQQAKLAAKEYQRRAAQYEALYEASSHYNDELKSRLKEHDISI